MSSVKQAILVVDDEPLVSKFVVAALAKSPYDVTVTTSGAEALALLNQAKFDLIIADMKMPSMDGIEFYANLVKTMPDMVGKMIVMTGDVMGIETRNFLAETKLPCIMKPFDTRTLQQMITRVLGPDES